MDLRKARSAESNLPASKWSKPARKSSSAVMGPDLAGAIAGSCLADAPKAKTDWR
jgi:hypothetical protein